MAPVTDAEPDDNNGRAGLAPAEEQAAEQVVDGHEVHTRAERLTVTASFSGPIPLPGLLTEYNAAVPGLGDEIAAQWKAEAEHRRETITYVRETDRLAMEKHYAGERRGLAYALALGIAVLLVVALALVLRQPIVGVAGLVSAIGGLVWAVRRSPHGPQDPRVDLGEEGHEDPEDDDI